MLKTTVLLTFLVSACSLDTESTLSSEICGGECEHPPDAPPPPPGPSCVEDGVQVFLDDAPANVDDDDERVTYCHATSSATNPYVVITTSIRACFAHTQHVHLAVGGHLDVFPTGGCAD